MGFFFLPFIVLIFIDSDLRRERPHIGHISIDVNGTWTKSLRMGGFLEFSPASFRVSVRQYMYIKALHSVSANEHVQSKHHDVAVVTVDDILLDDKIY